MFVGIFHNYPSFQGSDAIYIVKHYAVVWHEGPAEGLFKSMLEDAVAVDDNGNLYKRCIPSCTLQQIMLRILRWFIIKVTMLTMTTNPLQKISPKKPDIPML